MTAQEILTLIENVDPADGAKLDEIDARVWCWLDGVTFIGMYEPRSFPHLPEFTKEVKSGAQYNEALYGDMKYTRSLDAQAEAFPLPDWLPIITHNGQAFESELFHSEGEPFGDECILIKKVALHETEALARLHTRVQATAHERGES